MLEWSNVSVVIDWLTPQYYRGGGILNQSINLVSNLFGLSSFFIVKIKNKLGIREKASNEDTGPDQSIIFPYLLSFKEHYADRWVSQSVSQSVIL